MQLKPVAAAAPRHDVSSYLPEPPVSRFLQDFDRRHNEGINDGRPNGVFKASGITKVICMQMIMVVVSVDSQHMVLMFKFYVLTCLHNFVFTCLALGGGCSRSCDWYKR